jgi:plastocyanin
MLCFYMMASIVAHLQKCGPLPNCKTASADCTCAECLDDIKDKVKYDLDEGLCSAAYTQVWDFLPAQANISAFTGDTVEFEWDGEVPHNVVTWRNGTQAKLCKCTVSACSSAQL